MKLLNRIVGFVPRQAVDTNVIEANEIREELVQVRTQLRYLGRIYDTTEPVYQETVAQEINALKEKEHALIKRAKHLSGHRINIPTSLREHREA